MCALKESKKWNRMINFDHTFSLGRLARWDIAIIITFGFRETCCVLNSICSGWWHKYLNFCSELKANGYECMLHVTSIIELNQISLDYKTFFVPMWKCYSETVLPSISIKFYGNLRSFPTQCNAAQRILSLAYNKTIF